MLTRVKLFPTRAIEDDPKVLQPDYHAKKITNYRYKLSIPRESVYPKYVQ